MPADLATRLKLATQALHTEVERAGAMGALLAGRLERAGYLALLRNLHAVYAALEPRLAAEHAHPLVAPLEAGALARGAALAEDLHALHGPRWAAELPLAPAAAAYAARLAPAAPPALVAHAYVRYLGDLSGGRVLRTLVARRYALGEGPGTRFYDFGDEARAGALKQRLRAALATLAPAEAEAQAIVDEACWGFAQHRRLFEELV